MLYTYIMINHIQKDVIILHGKKFEAQLSMTV